MLYLYKSSADRLTDWKLAQECRPAMRAGVPVPRQKGEWTFVELTS